jgi:hypothetical protein
MREGNKMKRHDLMGDQLIAFYLDWFNNYLTVEKIAEHHGLDLNDAKALISIGMYMHYKDVEIMEVTA